MKQATLIYAGIVLLIGLIVYKFADLLDIFKPKEIRQTDKAYKKAIDYVIATELGILTDAQIHTYANTIYESLKYSRLDDDHGLVKDTLAKFTTDSDIYNLIKLFSKKQEYFFGIPTGDLKTLEMFITSNMYDGEIESINENFKKHSMKFQF